MRVSCIYLYGCSGINADDLASYLSRTFGISCTKLYLDYNQYEMGACAIGNIYRPHQLHSNMNPIIRDGHHLYDGYCMLDILGAGVRHRNGALHIIFTDLLACTYDNSDNRYHARSVILANPSMISIPGIIEAPAKSREYYADLMTGHDLTQYDGQFLTYDDKTRLDQVIRGYCMQCIFYYTSGEAFCMDKDCILYNAHWQSDLLHSQIESGRLCNHHQTILQKIRNGTA
ncbi:MAG: hypothetical protein F4202_00240 [Cenarchaeum sp. SB0677_bin_16]|nr:hypothetical protein [Cenarchaeum sp. SB0677_bin_16]